MTEQALAGTKVLDLTHYIAGPYCTRILAGFGADVIKIEKPGEGDTARHMGPFLNDESGPERSGLFLYLNSNKKSITLDLKSNTGVKIFKEMVKDADIVVESFRPGVMARFGLDYQTLEKINPGLIMTSISNFGQTGPYRDYKSAHLIAWGMSGARYCNGQPVKRPVQAGGWLTHYIAGLFAVAGTTTALYQRNESGIGQHVDISILESEILTVEYPSVVYSYRGELHHSAGIAGHIGILPCNDGYIGVNVLTQGQKELMCAYLGAPELMEIIEDPTKYQDFDEEIRARVTPQVIDKEKMELFQTALEWRIPYGLVPTTQEILDSPQHQGRGFFEEVEHSVMGRVTIPGAPFKMMGTPWRLISPAPLLAEHNEEVYCHYLGYSKEELVKFGEQGII